MGGVWASVARTSSDHRSSFHLYPCHDLCYARRMFQIFNKEHYPRGQKPAVSVSKAGLSVNRAAVLLLTGAVPDTNLDFVVLLDRETSRIGLRLHDEEDAAVDLFPGRRPRTGRRMPDGVRKFTNAWRIHGGAFATEAGLEIGRYEVSLKDVSIHPGPAMIVFGPEPIQS